MQSIRLLRPRHLTRKRAEIVPIASSSFQFGKDTRARGSPRVAWLREVEHPQLAVKHCRAGSSVFWSLSRAVVLIRGAQALATARLRESARQSAQVLASSKLAAAGRVGFRSDRLRASPIRSHPSALPSGAFSTAAERAAYS
jgi:hypothetical protein